jgi:hypothetical protein
MPAITDRIREVLAAVIVVLIIAGASLGLPGAALAGESSQLFEGCVIRSQELADIGMNPFGTVRAGQVVWDDPALRPTGLDAAREFGRLRICTPS